MAHFIGGYKVIPFGGYNFTSGQATTKATHKLDIYDRLESTNKRTIVEGLEVGGVEYDAMEVHFKVSSTNFVGTVYAGTGTVQFTITPEDTITITVS